MKYKRLERKDDEIKVQFELTADEWEKEVEEAYKNHKNHYKKEGFRNGNVPRAILEKQYGENLFYEDALNDSFGKYYAEMLSKEKDIYPVDYPRLTVEKIDKTGVKFTAIIDVMPEFKVENYNGNTIKKDKVSVTVKEIDAELSLMQDRHARFVEKTDRPVKDGDLINIDYSGSVDGVKFEGGTAEDQELTVGSHSFIPGFEEQLVGMNIGEEKDINVTFPTDYHAKDLSGKLAVFKVKVLGIREKELPALDDEFAKEVSECNTLDEYKKSIKERLTADKQAQADHNAVDKLIETIVNGVELKVPAKMVDRQLDYIVRDMNNRLSSQGITLEAYLGYLNMTEDQFRADRRKDAEESVKTSLVLEEIVDKENITVEDSEIDAKIEEIAKMYGQKMDKVKEMLTAQNALGSIKQEILTNKVINFLKENNNIA